MSLSSFHQLFQSKDIVINASSFIRTNDYFNNITEATKDVTTWRARRKGRTGPLAAWGPSHGVCLHTSFPLQPAWTLLPPMASSTYHISGFICQSTNPPESADFEEFLFLTTLFAVSNSEAIILTFPMAYALRMEFWSFWPPDAAVYCCSMYWADEDSCNIRFTR